MNINRTHYFKLNGACRILKGKKRNVILDTQKSVYYLIPNDLVSIIEQYNGEQISLILDAFGKTNRSTILDYFAFLEENDLLILFPNRDLLQGFSKGTDEWDDSSVIQNAIIDLNRKYSLNLKHILDQLKITRCRYLQIRSFGRNFTLNKFREFISLLHNYSFQFVQLHLENDEEFEKFNFKKFFASNPFIGEITFYNAKENKSSVEFGSITLNYIKENANTSSFCGIVSDRLFAPNMSHFTESQHHNTCLNRKISIDVNGEIKNCPSMAKSYGNIRDTKLIDVVNNPEFQKVWHIKKDEITKCKDCEFRHICTDCRAYIENPDDQYSAPLKCGYDPYTCEWEEWSTNPLKQQAIEFYGMQELVKK